MNSTSPIGSVSGSACLCNANTYLNAGMCESCPKGHHSAQGSTDVSMCLQGKLSLTVLNIVPANSAFLSLLVEYCRIVEYYVITEIRPKSRSGNLNTSNKPCLTVDNIAEWFQISVR